MTRFQRFVTVGLLAGGAGCIQLPPPRVTLEPDIGLQEVQRPAAAQQRYGAQTITPVRDSVGRYRFEDSLVAVTFFAGSNEIAFDLRNKTAMPIQIGWTEAAFVDPKGQSQPVMHQGVKYTDCSSPKAPSVVVGSGRVTDVVVPCNYVHFGSGWVQRNYFDFPASVSVNAATADAEEYSKTLKGQTIKLLLPIKVQDVVSDYTFTFSLQGVHTGREASRYP